jgi:hypothetical protein
MGFKSLLFWFTLKFSIILHLNQKICFKMAVTRLKRKDKRNKSIATNKIEAIKYLRQRPEIKLIDIDAIKAEFAQKAAK